jgi:hypothetical protein
MSLSRRDLVRIALAAPVGFAAARAVSTLGAVIGRAAPGLRPTAIGTSATRCAACGAADHTMLDPRCPAARQVI